MQGKSEGTVRMPSARASKRAPTWYSCTTTPKPLNGQPDPEAGHKRDFGVVVQLYQVGSCFKGLIEGVLVAPSDLP